MKKITLVALPFFALLGFSSAALSMDDPDLEGPVVKIDTVKSLITIKNSGPHAKSKNKEKKVYVKQGMINSIKLRDYVQVRLMADHYEAKMIERIAPPKEETKTSK